MRPFIKNTKLSETLTLSEYPEGFWIYDTTQGMNIAMRAKTSEEAFIEALTYYQHKLTKVESEHTHLKGLVDSFVENFIKDDEEW